MEQRVEQDFEQLVDELKRKGNAFESHFEKQINDVRNSFLYLFDK